MDGCTRQNPAYRLATERPRFGGAFLVRHPPRGGAGRGLGSAEFDALHVGVAVENGNGSALAAPTAPTSYQRPVESCRCNRRSSDASSAAPATGRSSGYSPTRWPSGSSSRRRPAATTRRGPGASPGSCSATSAGYRCRLQLDDPRRGGACLRSARCGHGPSDRRVRWRGRSGAHGRRRTRHGPSAAGRPAGRPRRFPADDVPGRDVRRILPETGAVSARADAIPEASRKRPGARDATSSAAGNRR